MRSLFCLLPLFALFFLAACGFQLRGAMDIPYARLYIASPSEDTTLGAALRRQIRAHQPEILVETNREATAVFRQLGNHREREITALNADGRAREYQLRMLYSFRIETPEGQALSEVANIRLTREVTYDDSHVLSKEQEEEFLWQDMERDLVQQILRRLATFKPTPAGDEGEQEQA
ncbi:MAG: LPS assembly lipoprotein LptE [Betaproteobacteria bacterium]|nr:LPS assembly lipoprotein LptE [Betaproteobacteria bacterium]